MKTLAALLLLTSAAMAAESGDLQLTLPPHFYAVAGVPMSLYYDNVVLTQTPESCRFEVVADVGKAEERRWTVTPTDKDVGAHSLEVRVKDATGKLLETARTTLHVAPRDAGAKGNLRLLIVGDSLTSATMYPNEIANLLSGPGNPAWTMIGTSKSGKAQPNVQHEGYGGWTWAAFLTKFDASDTGPAAGPLARKTTSPFLFADGQGKGVFDLPRYFREQGEGQPPDVVTFLLGINDCFGANPNEPKAIDAKIDEVLGNADKLLSAFHAAAPKAMLAVGLTTPPNSRQVAFEANYKDKYTRWGWKRIQHRLVQRMLERYGNRQRDGIHLVPTELNVDPVDGYPENNGVHPNPVGYAQIGDSFYAWLKVWMAAKR